MANLISVAGSKLYIGPKVVVPDQDIDLTYFAGFDWTEVNGWTSAGALGDTQEIISQSVINRGRVLKLKGTRDAGNMENTFLPMISDAGQIRMRQAIDSCGSYAFRIEWGAGCVDEGDVTISADSRVTWPGGHGLEPGSPVVFTPEDGTLPTGLSADTAYYIVDPTVLEFSLAATPGGAPIVATGAGTATRITATAQPAGQTDMFVAMVMPGARTGGEANTAQMRTWSIAVNTNIVEV